jgi:hypothetical protein
MAERMVRLGLPQLFWGIKPQASLVQQASGFALCWNPVGHADRQRSATRQAMLLTGCSWPGA